MGSEISSWKIASFAWFLKATKYVARISIIFNEESPSKNAKSPLELRLSHKLFGKQKYVESMFWTKKSSYFETFNGKFATETNSFWLKIFLLDHKISLLG